MPDPLREGSEGQRRRVLVAFGAVAALFFATTVSVVSGAVILLGVVCFATSGAMRDGAGRSGRH